MCNTHNTTKLWGTYGPSLSSTCDGLEALCAKLYSHFALTKKQVLASHGSTESLDFKEINESISTKFAEFVMISLIYEDVINVLFKILLARNL